MPTARHRLPRLAPVAALALVFSACSSYVDLDPSAEEVEIVKPERAEQCDRKGETRVSTADRIGFIARGEDAIERDLDRLARNSAADLGGDTAVRMTEITDGKATYAVYDCV